MTKQKKIVLFFICLLSPLALGFGSSLLSGQVKIFYQQLVKPSLAPPAWIFGPVWGILYLLMGLSFYLVFCTQAPAKIKRPALALYFIQLFINLIWSPVFFGWGSLWAAFGIILALDLAVVVTFILALKVNRRAGLLLIPYLLWITFASYLNIGVALLNP